LIKPVQRICKYPLLLRELIKNTPKDHKDKPLLESCMAKIEEVVILVNERTRAVGDRDKVMELQLRIDAQPPLDLTNSPRRIIKEGPIQKLISGKNKDRYLIILSDMLLVCKQPTTGKGKLQFEQAVDLQSAQLNQIVNTKPGASGTIKISKTLFEIITPAESYIFAPSNEQDRARWISAVEEALQKLETLKQQRNASDVPTQRNIVSRQSSAAQNDTQQQALRPQQSTGAFNSTPGGGLKKSNTLVKKKSNLWGRGKKNGSHETLADDTVQENHDEQQQQQQQPQRNTALQHVAPWAEEPAQAQNTEEHNKSRRGSASSQKSNAGPKTADVHGFPLWKAVDAGNGTVYYYNTESNETSWYHPAAITNSAIDTAQYSAEEIQKIYQQKLEYMQRLQEQANQLASTANAQQPQQQQAQQQQ
jgi:hypothetical protein